MIDTSSLRQTIINQATSGLLSSLNLDDTSVDSLIAELPEPSNKRKKLLSQSITMDKVGEIPEHWQWVRLGEISSYGDTPKKIMPSNITDDTWILELEDIENGGRLLSKKYGSDRKPKGEKTSFSKGQILYSKLRPYLKKVLIADEDGISTPELISFDVYAGIDPVYITYCLTNSYVDRVIEKRSYGIKMPRVDAAFMVNMPIPLPPIEEQRRIVETASQAFAEIDILESAQQDIADDFLALKNKIIDAGIRGELTKQLPEDGTAEELYQQIQIERKRQEQEKEIKEVELLPDIKEGEEPFSIPSTWMWTRFGNTSYIVRGGSPRPIKQFVTDDPDGINWIKIGDVEKGGKYIYETQEKIIPEGEKKSRRVAPGDFLLTNSMSFGRPYISKIDGCIHDGWLLIRNLKGFDDNYLYYLLSSTYMYNEFCQRASGSTVDNLNIEKVSSAFVPLPPIEEQKRIAEMIEELLAAMPE